MTDQPDASPREGSGTTRPIDLMTDLEETIVALSSAIGPGARAVVRLSGPQVLAVVGAVFVADSPLVLERGRREGMVRLPGLSSPLPADLYLWPSPRSYTAQH